MYNTFHHGIWIYDSWLDKPTSRLAKESFSCYNTIVKKTTSVGFLYFVSYETLEKKHIKIQDRHDIAYIYN